MAVKHMTNRKALLPELTQILGADSILTDEPMKLHTSFRIGGPADLFLLPKTEAQLTKLLKRLSEAEIPYVILGNGSNVLVSDAGYEGAVIQLAKNWQELTVEGEVISARAGASLARLGKLAAEESLTGFEFASGIPGTLGGGAIMNAGAYGGELKDVLTEVTVLDREGMVRTLPAGELEMSYRTSRMKREGMIVLRAKLRLAKGDPAAIRNRMEELREARTGKQPLEYPSAGSTFKRPEGHFAGKLIQDAGLAGFRVGGACVSEKHCGFVINDGGATAADVRTLMEEVQKIVLERFGVALEPEVIFLGR